LSTQHCKHYQTQSPTLCNRGSVTLLYFDVISLELPYFVFCMWCVFYSVIFLSAKSISSLVLLFYYLPHLYGHTRIKTYSKMCCIIVNITNWTKSIIIMLAKFRFWYSRHTSSTSHSKLKTQFYRFHWILIGWSRHFCFNVFFLCLNVSNWWVEENKIGLFRWFYHLDVSQTFSSENQIHGSCSPTFPAFMVVWGDQVLDVLFCLVLWMQRRTIKLFSGGRCEHFSVVWFPPRLPHAIYARLAFSLAQWAPSWLVLPVMRRNRGELTSW